VEKTVISFFSNDIDQALIKELNLTDRGMVTLMAYSHEVKKLAYEKLVGQKHLKGKFAYDYFMNACAAISKSLHENPNFREMYDFMESEGIDKKMPLFKHLSDSGSKIDIRASKQKECDDRCLKKHCGKKIADPEPLRKQVSPKGIKKLASWGLFFDWDGTHPSGDGTKGKMYFADPDLDYQVPECEFLEEYYKKTENQTRNDK